VIYVSDKSWGVATTQQDYVMGQFVIPITIWF